MKANYQLRGRPGADAGRNNNRRAPQATEARRRDIAVQFTNIKNDLVREFGTSLSGNGPLLKAVLNEAEALAWQTGYPHLLFPVLAEEKAAAVNLWAARQRRVRHASREIALAV